MATLPQQPGYKHPAPEAVQMQVGKGGTGCAAGVQGVHVTGRWATDQVGGQGRSRASPREGRRDSEGAGSENTTVSLRASGIAETPLPQPKGPGDNWTTATHLADLQARTWTKIPSLPPKPGANVTAGGAGSKGEAGHPTRPWEATGWAPPPRRQPHHKRVPSVRLGTRGSGPVPRPPQRRANALHTYSRLTTTAGGRRTIFLHSNRWVK